MELILNNIGIIHDETNIKFDGITVIAGENGSGKSTISKSLYCMFRSFYDVEYRIYQDRMREIASCIFSVLRLHDIPRRRTILRGGFIERLMENYANKKDIQTIIDDIRNEGIPLFDGVPEEELASRIEQILLISDDQIRERMTSRIFQSRFDGNIGNVNYPEEESKIRLIVRGNEGSVGVSHEGKIEIQQQLQLIKDVIYVDDSYSSDSLFGDYGKYKSRRDKGLEYDVDSEVDQTAAGELVGEKKAIDILRMMDEAGIGHMHLDEKNRWVYEARDLRTPIGIENISSGTKSFFALKNLFEGERIDRKGVMILDEPEIHLHPKWQKLYAEIIVLLQKTYDLTLLINTHSTDFISFLEFYTRKYQTEQNCHYYLIKKNEDAVSVNVQEVTNNIDEIYKELSLPFIRISEQLEESR